MNGLPFLRRDLNEGIFRNGMESDTSTAPVFGEEEDPETIRHPECYNIKQDPTFMSWDLRRIPANRS